MSTAGPTLPDGHHLNWAGHEHRGAAEHWQAARCSCGAWAYEAVSVTPRRVRASIRAQYYKHLRAARPG